MNPYPQLQPSLAGFNNSKRANHESVEKFVESYLKVNPEREKELYAKLADLYGLLEKMIGKALDAKSQKSPNRPEGLVKDPWIPREMYIPMWANPRSSWSRQAHNVAKNMRKQLEERGIYDGLSDAGYTKGVITCRICKRPTDKPVKLEFVCLDCYLEMRSQAPIVNTTDESLVPTPPKLPGPD